MLHRRQSSPPLTCWQPLLNAAQDTSLWLAHVHLPSTRIPRVRGERNRVWTQRVVLLGYRCFLYLLGVTSSNSDLHVLFLQRKRSRFQPTRGCMSPVISPACSCGGWAEPPGLWVCLGMALSEIWSWMFEPQACGCCEGYWIAVSEAEGIIMGFRDGAWILGCQFRDVECFDSLEGWTCW